MYLPKRDRLTDISVEVGSYCDPGRREMRVE